LVRVIYLLKKNHGFHVPGSVISIAGVRLRENYLLFARSFVKNSSADFDPADSPLLFEKPISCGEQMQNALNGDRPLF
jgi:hypothetical protein